MKQERMRSRKILDELMSFCFKVGVKDIHVDFKDGEENVMIHVEGKSQEIPIEELENLKSLLQVQRQDQIEGYYWGLAGENDHYQELPLVGMMIDEADVQYDNQQLNITVYRNKENLPPQ
ncbi:hypothetical protein [Alkaliphilus metalliredigens]|nr:hypothetical protein [Alkaliphilus metalliredigens]